MVTGSVRLTASEFFMSAAVPLSTSGMLTWQLQPWRNCGSVIKETRRCYYLLSHDSVPAHLHVKFDITCAPFQRVELRGNKLVMRYPDRWLQGTNSVLSFSAAGTQQTSAAAG